jgi:hypothetical protein
VKYLSCAKPERLQSICDGLSAEKIDGFLRKWLRLLPHPFTGEDRKAGYRYDLSILQAEFSLTQVLDRPAHGRLFFEQVIRENLDLGRNSGFAQHRHRSQTRLSITRSTHASSKPHSSHPKLDTSTPCLLTQAGLD